MGRTSAYATPSTMKPLNLPNAGNGKIVKYQPNSPVIPGPVRLYPEPYRSGGSSTAFKIPSLSKPGSMESELQKTVDPRRPVVDSDGRSSSQSRNPQNYPDYPNPADGWKSFADFDAWKNGESRQSIDNEREAYEFTREWGKTGGMLYPLTEEGPRTPIISGNFEAANRYRVRNGLPSIDRYGYEQASPINPSSPPRGDFASNPFKLPRPAPGPDVGTPSNFDENPYNFDIDPDTGKPYTDLQRRRGDELGRPAWHINPETGNPWGADEPGTPLPLPFDGAPGGGLRYPSPKGGLPPLGTWEITISPTINDNIRVVNIVGYSTDSPIVIQVAPVVSGFSTCNAAALQTSGGIHQISECYSHYPINVYGTFTASDVGVGTDRTPVEFTPIGNPAPVAQPFAPSLPAPKPLPQPVQDPRANPTKPKPLPYAPNKKPFDPPNSAPVNPRPVPEPVTLPKPQIPGQPNYAPSPRPYPRTDPSGKPQPNFNPSNQPAPARPSNPKPETQIDRPKNPAPIDTKTPKCPSPCPDPCIAEKVVQITYKKFIGCNKLPSGAPDRFRNLSIDVPSKMAAAITVSLNSIADIESQVCEPCCYWDIIPGLEVSVYSSVPQFIGQEIALPKGCTHIRIAYDITSAKEDGTLRNLRRIANGNTNENTFVNTARIWIIDSKGNAIYQDEIWVPNTVVAIPFSYRDEVCRLRLMPKSLGINFNVLDTGDRWVQKKE